MRRSGYSTLTSTKDHQKSDYEEVDGFNLEDAEEAKTFIDCRTERPPYKSLFLIFFLFFMGMFTLIISSLIFLGHLDEAVYADRMIPLMILGLLMFIPGVYYTTIVYFIVRARPGYTYDMIPSCS